MDYVAAHPPTWWEGGEGDLFPLLQKTQHKSLEGKVRFSIDALVYVPPEGHMRLHNCDIRLGSLLVWGHESL